MKKKEIIKQLKEKLSIEEENSEYFSKLCREQKAEIELLKERNTYLSKHLDWTQKQCFEAHLILNRTVAGAKEPTKE
ncbi:MAG: hypothetical protein IQL11_05870 [Bacteroidales bacterium]|nr:hypothetical protein [Bacteroidales bacterium]